MNLKYFDLKSQKNAIYCFVATKSPEIISKIKASKSKWTKLEAKSDFETFLFVNLPFNTEKGVISFSVINDIGDYDVSQISAKLMDGDFVSNYDGDSLISLSCVDKQRFACMTDFWGIKTHYWSQSENTFVCSNNIFLVSSLIGRELCKDAVYEYLFFLAPRKDKTWFENIKCLLPGQQLIFDIDKNSVKLSKSTDFSNLFKSHNFNIFKTVEEFFLKVKDRIGSATINIALSAGTDSRTVLACLRHSGMKPNAISYGRNYLAETHQIKKLVNKLNIPWQLVNLEGYEDSFDELISKGTYISNGLIGPDLVHRVFVYDQISKGNVLFEGILGSEFVKGEISDIMTSALHRDVIVNGISIAEAIEKHYPELSIKVKESMSKYIDANYGTELLDINSSDGLKCYQQFAFEIIPSKIFVAPILFALANGMSPYYPFLSPKILRSIFNNGYGISSYVSLRDDFPGYIKSPEAEAKIVKYADKQIFTSLLTRYIRFKDILYPLYFSVWKMRFHFIIERFKYKHFMSGQRDKTKMNEVIKHLSKTAATDLKILSLDQQENISNLLLQSSIVTLSYILKMADPVTRKEFIWEYMEQGKENSL